MSIKFIQHLLSLSYIWMFQFYDFFLNSLRDLSQHDIVMASMLVDTKLAIEGLIDLAAVLNLLILMLLAEELTGIVVEVLDFVQYIFLEQFFLRVRLELFKRLHGIVVVVLSCRGLWLLRFQVIVSWGSSRCITCWGYLWLRGTSWDCPLGVLRSRIIFRLFEWWVFERHLQRWPESYERFVWLARWIHRSSIKSFLIIFI